MNRRESRRRCGSSKPNATNESLLSRFAFTIFPCNNPTGWERDTRENADGIDLNRTFNVRKPPAEAAIISSALQGNCFDLIFEMHEDIDAPGLYLYEIAEDPEDLCRREDHRGGRGGGVPYQRRATASRV